MSEPMPATDWFYAVRGTKIGPVSDAHIKELLSKGGLEPNVYVWRKGLKDWIPIRESELSEPINDAPPPLTASLVSNTWVWIIAFLPLVFAVIDAAIIQMKVENLVASGWWNALEFSNQGGLLTVAPKQPSGLPWGIPPAFYALFGLLDERRLKKAGYSSKYMPLLESLHPREETATVSILWRRLGRLLYIRATRRPDMIVASLRSLAAGESFDGLLCRRVAR